MARFTDADELALIGLESSVSESGEALLEAAVERNTDGVRLVGVDGERVSAAQLFDGLAGHLGPAAQRHFEETFRVIAAPGESVVVKIEPGDLLITRALAEGDLARVAAIVRTVESAGADGEVVEAVAAPLTRELRRSSGASPAARSRRQTFLFDLRLMPRDQLIIRVRNGNRVHSETVEDVAIEDVESMAEAAGPCPPPAPLPSTCIGVAQKETLSCFGFGSPKVLPRHQPQIVNIAHCILESHKTSNPITALQVVGHTDPVGSDADNDKLGLTRAENVKKALLDTLDRMTGGRAPTVTITPSTRGERDPVPGDSALSRRVEILSPFAFAPPAAPPAPPAPVPVPTTPPTPIPGPATALDPARWTRIMGPRDLHTGNFVDFLIDGTATFIAMRDAMLTAKNREHYIYLLGWWLTDDFPLVQTTPPPPLVTVRQIFANASAAGVQIRAMLWDQVGTQNTAEVGRISGLATGAAILDNHTFSRRLFLGQNIGSHHMKVLVVKGEQGLIAFCGGIDLNPDRLPAVTGSGGSGSGGSGSSGSGSSGSGAIPPLHDISCRITGPSAHDLLTTFIDRWDAHPDHGAIDRGPKGNLLGRVEPRPRAIPPRPIASGSTSGNCASRITRTYTPITPLAPGTRAVKQRSIRETLTLAIQNARRFIYMEEQYLWSLEAAALLNTALSRIQHLTILIPHSSILVEPRQWEMRLRFINRLTRGAHGHKARIFFLFTPPHTPGTKPVFGPHTYIHAKTWVFDDELAVIGSANCNLRGWSHDSEANAVLFEDVNPSGETFAQRLRMALWAEHLNVAPSAVVDGVASASLWTPPPPGANILPYNPTADTDPFWHRAVDLDVIDPDGGP